MNLVFLIVIIVIVVIMEAVVDDVVDPLTKIALGGDKGVQVVNEPVNVERVFESLQMSLESRPHHKQKSKPTASGDRVANPVEEGVLV